MVSQPRIWLAAVSASDWLSLGKDRLRTVLSCGIYGVDVRVASLSRGPTKTELELANAVRRSGGLGLRCHSWVGYRSGDIAAVTPRIASAQGKQLALAADDLGAESASANAERDWFRGPVHGGVHVAHPLAVTSMHALLDEFYTYSTLACDYLGLADPREHYARADLNHDGVDDRVLPFELRRRFRLEHVMAYQATVPGVEAKLEAAEARWPEHFKAGRVVPWLAPGRVKQYGSEVVTRTIIPRFAESTIYIGFGAIGQLLEGNRNHPAIVQVVPELVAGKREGYA